MTQITLKNALNCEVIQYQLQRHVKGADFVFSRLGGAYMTFCCCGFMADFSISILYRVLVNMAFWLLR